MYTSDRYTNNGSIQFLPEICNPVIDFAFPTSSNAKPSTELPIYIAVIDMSQTSGLWLHLCAPLKITNKSTVNSLYYQTIQQNITALLEAIPETALFGLITFSDRVGIWDLLHRQETEVQNVFNLPIPNSSKLDISIDQVISFENFLVPVCFSIQLNELKIARDWWRSFNSQQSIITIIKRYKKTLFRSQT